MAVFHQEDIMIKILIPRELGLVLQDSRVTVLEQNLFLMDLEEMMGTELKMYLFPFNGNFTPGNFDTDLKIAEHESMFERSVDRYRNPRGGVWWIFKDHTEVRARHYQFAVVGHRKKIEYTSRSGIVFGGLDFVTDKFPSNFHFLIIQRNVTPESLVPLVEQISTKKSGKEEILKAAKNIAWSVVDIAVGKGVGRTIEYLSSSKSKNEKSHPEELDIAVVVRLEQKLDFLWSFLKAHLHARILVFLSTCEQAMFVFEAFKKLSVSVLH